MLMLRMLKLGGRCAVIVPDGVLFGSSKAHVALRKMLVEDNQLEGVIKLPAGVFKPYAGVSTAILIFTKGGHTTDVFFYDVQADGFSLDDKRVPVPENDLPDVRERWKTRNPKKDKDRTDKAFFVPKKEIVANKYDLSLNRYREIVHEEVEYEAPKDDHRPAQDAGGGDREGPARAGGDAVMNHHKVWPYVEFEKVTSLITDGTHNSPQTSDKGDYRYVTSKNVRRSISISQSAAYVSESVHREIYKACPVRRGDVLSRKMEQTLDWRPKTLWTGSFLCSHRLRCFDQKKACSSHAILFIG